MRAIKIPLLTAGLCLVSLSVLAQLKPYVINGTIKGKKEGYVYLTYQPAGSTKMTMDSAFITGGKFTFKGEIEDVLQAYVLSEKNPVNINGFLQILISPGKLKLSLNAGNFSDGKLSGTEIQEDMNRLNQSKAAYMVKIKKLQQVYDKANRSYILAVREKKEAAIISALKDSATIAKDAMSPVISRLMQKDKEFMNQNPTSYVTATLLAGAINRMTYLESLERFEKLPTVIKNSSIGKKLFSEMEKLKRGSPGSVAINFISTELRGEQLILNDYKGKYVLIDFWASWCVPCRKGNPHLLQLYSKYKPKGFEIIGVSDDDSNQDAWKKAIEHDKIAVWKHILRGLKRAPDGDYDRSNSINDKYSINSLPTKILIDPNGVIIGRFVGDDEAMDKQLAEIFGL